MEEYLFTQKKHGSIMKVITIIYQSTLEIF